MCWLLGMFARYAWWNWATHIFSERSTQCGGSPKNRFLIHSLCCQNEAKNTWKVFFSSLTVMVQFHIFSGYLKKYGDNKYHGNQKNQHFFGFRFFITEMLPFHKLMQLKWKINETLIKNHINWKWYCKYYTLVVYKVFFLICQLILFSGHLWLGI